MSVDLSTTYGGLKIKNPLICSSGPNTGTPANCEKAARAGFSVVVLKPRIYQVPDIVARGITRPMYRMREWSGRYPWKPAPPKKSDPVIKGKKGALGSYNVGCIPYGLPSCPYSSDEEYIYYVNETKKRVGNDVKVVAQIYAVSEENWDAGCRMISKTKADAMELCIACPILSMVELPPELKPGVPPASEPEVCGRFTKWCVDRLDIPVSTKMFPMEPRNLFSAQAVQAAGAKGLIMGDSASGPQLTVDIETATPGLHPDYPTPGGGWGPWIIPFISNQVSLFRGRGIDIDICAVGGVVEWQDMVRYIMCGASSVGVCRTVMAEGWGVATEWLESLTQWMEKKGYKSVKEMIGIANNKLVRDPSKIPMYIPQKAGGPPPTQEFIYDDKKCIECGWCGAACMYDAIEMVNDHPKFDMAKCERCGTCESLCPVGAITIKW